jgi:putative endonuclease
MGFFVYIIQSSSDNSSADNSYYKGFSENPRKRLIQHNNGECQYTSQKMSWRLVYVEELATKREGLIRGKVLKKYSHKQIEQLISSGKNILNDFQS